VDVHILAAERRRISEQLRSTLTCLGILRAQIIGCLTDEARHHLLAALDEESRVCCELGDWLLRLEAMIMNLQKDRSEDDGEESSVRLDRHRGEVQMVVQRRSD
jgi:hypothetical protein